jgi:cytoskeletal protein CcmA (bactofilin family)
MWKRERPEPVDLEHVMNEAPVVVAPPTRPATPPPAPVVEAPQQRATATKGSTLGATLRFKGDLVADEDLVVQGQIEGSILHTRSLTIGSQGLVRGDIRARRIIVEGSVEGNLYALERATLRPSAIVRGDIYAAEIVIEDGASLNGRIDMDNAPTVPTIKIPVSGATGTPGATEPVASELSSSEADAVLRGS